MKGTLSNRPLIAIMAVFTVVSAYLLHGNPFGSGPIGWPIAIIVALVVNSLLAFLLAPWAAPYLATTGGSAGANKADPQTVAVVERWTAGVLMFFGSAGLIGATLASNQVVITPTKRLEENAKLVQRTVELQAPEIYKRQLPGADTWKMSNKTYRTCVPTPESLHSGWCVLTQVRDDKLVVVRFGPGRSNAAQALEWHPELKDQPRR